MCPAIYADIENYRVEKSEGEDVRRVTDKSVQKHKWAREEQKNTAIPRTRTENLRLRRPMS